MQNLSRIPIEYEWSFSDKTIKDTSYITHGYYTYPAKFIPQLAARLINEYSQPGDIVIDPFMGSGTTIVEAIVNKRIGIGTDINEIAALLCKVKSTPIETELLIDAFENIISQLPSNLNGNIFKVNKVKKLNGHKQNIVLPERVHYWFKPDAVSKLSVLLKLIRKIDDANIREFFLIAFAQILKSCSIWHQKSIKPLRDNTKQEIDPFAKFKWQSAKMIRKNAEFNYFIDAEVKRNLGKYLKVKNSDARKLPCAKGKATLIVTSPPYVTSYEYADLHQLASLWFGYLNELSSFRPKFIGSSARKRNKIDLQSSIADEIVKQLGNNKKSNEVESYFADMLESFVEMKRVLKVGGVAAIVIGNTKLQGVAIQNAEVFQQQFESIGFKTVTVIHREIPSKMLPSTRDPNTGKFTKANSDNKLLVYPTEYILVMEKIK